MSDHQNQSEDGANGDPRIERLIGYLSDGPLPSPPAEIARRAKRLRRPQRGGPGALQQAAEWVAQLIFDSRAKPALAGFRGVSTRIHLIYAFEAGEVDLQVEQRKEGDPAIRIMGQVESEKTARFAQLERTPGFTVAQSPVDARGMFDLVAEPGAYDLTIMFEQHTMRICNLEL